MASGQTLGTLVPVGGGDPIPLTQNVLTVGRRPSCHICLKFPDVSGLHCEFLFQDGRWIVRDLGSSNGVKVGGQPIAGRKSLLPGTEVCIGNHRFTIEYTAQAGVGADEYEEDLFGQSLMEKAGLEKPKPTRRNDF
jgi:adenylate cyclase